LKAFDLVEHESLVFKREKIYRGEVELRDKGKQKVGRGRQG